MLQILPVGRVGARIDRTVGCIRSAGRPIRAAPGLGSPRARRLPPTLTFGLKLALRSFLLLGGHLVDRSLHAALDAEERSLGTQSRLRLAPGLGSQLVA